MLTSLTIQTTLPLPQRDYRPGNTSSGLAPPISRQSRSWRREELKRYVIGHMRRYGTAEILVTEAQTPEQLDGGGGLAYLRKPPVRAAGPLGPRPTRVAGQIMGRPPG
jgi:hypothetical protein